MLPTGTVATSDQEARRTREATRTALWREAQKMDLMGFNGIYGGLMGFMVV
jgi:hypothetical protein